MDDENRNMWNLHENDLRLLSERIARLEASLQIMISMAEKHPLTAKFVKKFKCELRQ